MRVDAISEVAAWTTDRFARLGFSVRSGSTKIDEARGDRLAWTVANNVAPRKNFYVVSGKSQTSFARESLVDRARASNTPVQFAATERGVRSVEKFCV